MRKLKLQVQMTIDGYMGGPNGEMNWITPSWTPDIAQYVTELTEPVDTIILGRKLAEGFIPHWATVAENSNHPEFGAGQKFTHIPKVVFTKTLSHCPWPNTVLATGDLVDEITQLKQQQGQDIIAYGGATFVSALIRQGLVDELHLFVNPTAIGRGLALFQKLDGAPKLTLKKSIPFECGIVLLCYQTNANQ